MRFLAILAVSAAVLTPVMALADSSQPQAAATADAQAAPASPAIQTAQATPAASVSNSGDLDQVVCRMGTPPTGTRLGGSRECHTQREWNKRQEDAQRNLAATQKQGLQGLAGPGIGPGK